MDSFYSETELKQIGFKFVGENVKFSKKTSIYGAEFISIGSNVRVDDFCILSGSVIIGNYIHIAAYSALYGGDVGIEIGDFSNISSRVAIYAISDDYSGESLTNPMIPEQYKKIQKEKVIIEKHVIIGSGSTILPGVILKEGSAFGSMSLVKNSSEPWSINVGIPSRKIKNRNKQLLDKEIQFINSVKL